ncbi:MAG: hypothetical protein MZW92_78815 [Comamonadaceae bacterium]|nr:hypothetical protein [Comamonadaceae bacterium]
MKTHDVHWLFAALGAATLGAAAATVAAAPPAYPFVWSTVVNNGDFMPTAPARSDGAGSDDTAVPQVQQLQPALGERRPAGGHPGAQPRRTGRRAAGPRRLYARHGRRGAGGQDPRPQHPGAASPTTATRCSSSRRPSRASTSGRTPWPPAATTSPCGRS